MFDEGRNESEEYEGELIQETELGILLQYEGENYWLPKSQIEIEGDPVLGKELTVHIPNWLAIENGMM